MNPDFEQAVSCIVLLATSKFGLGYKSQIRRFLMQRLLLERNWYNGDLRALLSVEPYTKVQGCVHMISTNMSTNLPNKTICIPSYKHNEHFS